MGRSSPLTWTAAPGPSEMTFSMQWTACGRSVLRQSMSLVPASRLSSGAQVRQQVLGDHPMILGDGQCILRGRHIPYRARPVRSYADRSRARTGFTGFLSLPPALVTELGLSFPTNASAMPADGSLATFSVHNATVLWDCQPRRVYAHVSDATPLMGIPTAGQSQLVRRGRWACRHPG